MQMKHQKLIKILTAVLAMAIAVALLVGCGNDETAPAASNNINTSQSPSDDIPRGSDTSDQDPSQNHAQSFNLTTINTTFDDVQISSTAMSMEDAAQIGANYILDIFGESIDGMYVELEFSDWDHMTRTLWNGSVSVNRRNTLEHRARLNELNEEFMARYNAGEDIEDIQADMGDLFLNYNYTLARFYFAIDAVTGKRINLWQSTPEMINQQIPDPMAMDEYVEREWGGDWGAAFEADATPQQKEEFGQLAMMYAQRHFNTTTVIDVSFSNAFANLIYAGNGNFNRTVSVTFVATDETGREAMVTIGMDNRVLSSISTISNDFVPFDYEMMAEEFERRPTERDGYDDTDER